MNGVVTIGSGVPTGVGSSDIREFRQSGVLAEAGSADNRNFHRSLGPLTHMVTSTFMGLQILTRIHTRRIVEERGKKNRDKSQGTLTLGLGHHGGCTLKEGKKTEENKIHMPRTNLRARAPPQTESPPLSQGRRAKPGQWRGSEETESADRTPQQHSQKG